MFTILAFIGGAVFGATAGYVWVNKQVKALKDDLAKFGIKPSTSSTPATKL